MKLWLPGAEKIPGPHSNGLPMGGGEALCTHHITVSPKGSYEGVKAALLREAFEPTLLLDPTTGDRGQFLPANRGAFAMEHNGPPTNTEGTVNVQIEWVWPSMSDDITKAPHFAAIWSDLIPWLDQLGIPRTWPFGFTSTSRSATTWRKAGHRGHINAPGNSHVDNLPAAKQPAWPSLPHPLTEAHRSEVGDLAGTFTARAKAKQAFVAADRADVQHLIAAARAALNVKES